MKNYIRDVIDRYINHDYPKEVDQDFRTWLTDEERADEKDHELNQRFFVKFGGTSSIVNKESWLSVVCFLPYCTSAFLPL